MGSMLFDLEMEQERFANLKVIGVGGAGGNAINRMISSSLTGVDFIVSNTDAQVLATSQALQKVQLGRNLTKGLGAGGDPDVGRRAAQEDAETIAETLAGADMVFITAGMGGGTGTGAAAVIAEVARELGALCVAVVTKPFSFEGRRRMQAAEQGLEELREKVDTLITIPNDRLLSYVPRDTPLDRAFEVADEVLLEATRGISDLITIPGLINLDFADVRSVMRNGGNALMGTGRGSGESRAVEAARAAISSPLLEDMSIAGADAVLVNITGGKDLSLHEVHEANAEILAAAGEEADVKFGAVIDPEVEGEITVTVIATGFVPDARVDRIVLDMQHMRPVPEPIPAAEDGDELPWSPRPQPASGGRGAAAVRGASHRTAKSSGSSVVTRAAQAAAAQRSARSTANTVVPQATTAGKEGETARTASRSGAVSRQDSGSLRDMQDLDVPTFMRRHAE
jgi:cell division protein FtsZ